MLNRYYKVGIIILVVGAVLIAVGVFGGFLARAIVLTIVTFMVRILIHAAIGYAAYWISKRYVRRSRAIILGIVVAVLTYLFYVSYFGIWLALPR
jgi:hypothetical protein